MRKPQGFTLIELLVVIAIIAILAAILFPVFARARENARKATCSSHLKQIGTAVMMYVQDYDERYPGMWMMAGGNGNRRGIGFYDLVGPYTKNEKFYVCPSGNYRNTSFRSQMPNPEGFWGRIAVASYTAPVSLSQVIPITGPTAWTWNQPGRAMAEIQRPADCVWLVEGNTTQPGDILALGFSTSGQPLAFNESTQGVGQLRYRHNRMMNVIYCDGHVKAVPQLTNPKVFSIN